MKIRRPEWENQFYPGNPDELDATLTEYFEKAALQQTGKRIVGLIAPHAGYPYSGQTAAVAYKQLENQQYETVVVCSPSHATPINGVSVYDGDYYETPLGRISVDTELTERLAQHSSVIQRSSAGHEGGLRPEHALEVQLPFLQKILREFKLVPIVFNDFIWNVCQELGNAMAKVLDSEKTLIVASSDLYHGEVYEEAMRTDKMTLEAIEAFDAEKFCNKSEKHEIMACGAGPITALMVAAKQWNTQAPRVLTHTTSADVVDESVGKVVGYAAAIIEK